MKLPILLGAAFLTGLGATTGAAILGAPDPVALSHSADSVATDASASGPADSAGTRSSEPSQHDSTASSPPVHGTSVASADSMRSSLDERAVTPVVPAPPIVPALPSVARPKPDYRQLGRIVSNMPKAEAAALLALLPDDEVDGILREVGVRQAAALLTELPKDRAAQLSRRMLHGSESKP